MNELLVIVIVVLFPGIISVVISDKIAAHSNWTSFKYLLYSVVYGLAVYSVLQVLLYIKDFLEFYITGKSISTDLQVWSIISTKSTNIPASEVIIATFLAIPVAFFFSWLINYKIFNKFAQFINVTSKYGDENLFSYYLNAKEIDWLYVRDPSLNLTYQGRVMNYSENSNIQEIVLAEVTVYRYEDSAELYSLPTIYLSNKSGEFIIEAIPNENLGETDG